MPHNCLVFTGTKKNARVRPKVGNGSCKRGTYRAGRGAGGVEKTDLAFG